MGKRSRDGDDLELAEQDEAGQSPAKFVELDDPSSYTTPSIQCLLPPHSPLDFCSSDEFNAHYAREHTNRCVTCGKNFPSTHFLALHIDENHNPIREVKETKGEKTYACFLPDCDKLCSTPQKRRLHLIDKHMFPKVYNFRVIDKGIDKTDSMLRTGQKHRLSLADSTRRSSSGVKEIISKSKSTQADQTVTPDARSISSTDSGSNSHIFTPESEECVEILGKSLAALQFIPPSVSARRQKAG